jgi:DNA-binding NarL/FixJ family response regulator
VSIRVLLADDQALVRAGFRKILEAEPDIDVIAEVSDGDDAVAMTRSDHVDVVLMDIRMPRLDGIAATQAIADAGPTPRVLILTTYGLDEYVFAALRAGASGFLVKDAPPEDLLDAVRTIARGDALLDPSITRSVIDEFVRRSPRTPASGDATAQLTDRELEILKLLTTGLSNAEIASGLIVSEATVKTHVTHLLMKLGVRDRVQAVIYAYETGIVRPGEGPTAASS